MPYPAHAVLGFPGQFANSQQLAGAQHYYNRYRDYDVNTGRYIQADPIGLAGDDNPYAYAGGNPLRYLDPSGEYAQFVIGAGIGFGMDLAGQLVANRGNWRCIKIGQLAMSTAVGALGGGLGGKGLTSALGRLSNRTKGDIGEALSILNNRIKGSREIFERNSASIPGQSTQVDSTWRSIFGRNYYVEAKFGKSTLTKPQRRAAAALGDQYHVERWDYPFFGRVGAYFGGTAAAGALPGGGGNGCGC